MAEGDKSLSHLSFSSLHPGTSFHLLLENAPSLWLQMLNERGLNQAVPRYRQVAPALCSLFTLVKLELSHQKRNHSEVMTYIHLSTC